MPAPPPGKTGLKSGPYQCLQKPVNLKCLTVNRVLVLLILNNVPAFRFFFFFVQQKSKDNSYIIWNRFQDYQVRITLTDHFLVQTFDDLTRHL